jgi:hypothetical protein
MKTAVVSVLAMALAFAWLTGCSGSHHRTKATPVAAESGPASSPPPEPLTPQRAAAAFRSFVTDDDVARAAGDERLALWWTSEGQSQLTAAGFRRAIGANTAIPRYRYDAPQIYTPHLRPEDPQWFVVIAKRSDATGKNPHTVLMGFVRTKAQNRWRLSLAALLDKKQKPPKIAVDAGGYAKALATFDQALLIAPRDVPSIQATLAEEGPKNVAVNVMETGKHTTDFYTADQKATKPKKSTGLRVNTVYPITSFPIFPLATTDGGGIVLYALSRESAITKNKKKPGHVPLPADAAPFISAPIIRNELDVSQTLQFAALVPAKTEKDAKAVVIAADGGTVRASVPATR